MGDQEGRFSVQDPEIEREVSRILGDHDEHDLPRLRAELSKYRTSLKGVLALEMEIQSNSLNREIADLHYIHEALEATLYMKKAEILALRRELRPSRAVLEDLCLDIQDVEDEIQRQDDLLDLINRFRPQCKPLPFDVLRLIFQALHLNSGFLHSSLACGPQSSWVQSSISKESLTMVCRSWRDAALPFLYEEITLRRVGQLFALARTLRQSNYNHLIRRLSFAFHIPEGYVRLVEKNASDILARCSSLTEISFESAFTDWLPSADFTRASIKGNNPLVAALLEAGPKITKFAYFDPEFSSFNGRSLVPVEVVKLFTHLVSLTLMLPPSIHTQSRSADLEARSHIKISSLELMALEDITLWYRDADIYLDAIAQSWEMPKLKSVSFRALTATAPLDDIEPGWSLYCRFFEKFGAGLRCLDFGPIELHPVDVPVSATAMLQIVQKCRSLQHLVVSLRYMEDSLISLCNEQSPLHIDLWVRVSPRAERRLGSYRNPLSPLLSDPVCGRFLPCIRLIDRGLNHIPDVPKLLPPAHEPRIHTPLIHRMPGFSIVQTDWCLLRQSADWKEPWDGLPETLQDHMETYNSPSEPDEDENDASLMEREVVGTSSDDPDASWVPPEDWSDLYSSDSWVDPEEVNDDYEIPNLGWYAHPGQNQQERPGPVIEEPLQLTEEDILDIFAKQLGTDAISDVDDSSE